MQSLQVEHMQHSQRLISTVVVLLQRPASVCMATDSASLTLHDPITNAWLFGLSLSTMPPLIDLHLVALEA